MGRGQAARVAAAGSGILSGLTKRSFSLAGHRTSVALEAAFWEALRDIARSRGVGLAELVASVDAARDGTAPLASTLRVLALQEALSRRIGALETGIDAPGPRPKADQPESVNHAPPHPAAG
jgi:predicted DNA-binding ribbon-helix-helix protein